MIKYTLRCAEDHSFDSWFASAEAFDSLAAAGRLACAVCGTPQVEKALMAPRVAAGRKARKTDAAAPTTGGDDAPVPALSAPMHPMERALRALREKIERESRYVGGAFAAEARAMHLGEREQGAIHGEATGAEVRSLLEDGVPVAPLPFTPARKVN